jgi:surfactin synthase thioesterase subunit
MMAAGLREYLDVPFGFFGHCGSALAAYEVSAELPQSGMRAPAALFVSSEVVPQDGPAGRFLSMSDAELGAELEELIRAQGGTPTAELIDFCLEVLLADVETNKRYIVPVPYQLSCPITAIGWTDDDEIPFSTMSGWSSCGDAAFVQLPGSHHRFIKAPQELIDLMCPQPGRTAMTGQVGPDQERRWLKRFSRPANGAVRLLCFASAGGSAGTFRHWAPMLPPHVELVGVQLPGRADRFHEPRMSGWSTWSMTS